MFSIEKNKKMLSSLTFYFSSLKTYQFPFFKKESHLNSLKDHQHLQQINFIVFYVLENVR
jgi:hypothetical protein